MHGLAPLPLQVPSGRPSPYMAWSALQQMGVWEVGACVKVGDTVADVGEGLNAGMWAVGVTATGNEVSGEQGAATLR